MSRWTRAAAILVVAAVVAGCSDSVSGSGAAESGSSTAARLPEIVGSVSSPLLDRLPTEASTLSDIALIDPGALTEVALHSSYRASEPQGSQRPESQTVWLSLVAVSNTCGQVLDGGKGLRSGPAGPISSVVLGEVKDGQGLLAVCGGAVPTRASLQDVTLRGKGISTTAVAGVTGYAVDNVWIGVDQQQTFLTVGEKMPKDLVQQAIAGKPPDMPLSKDNRVRAVLGAAPHAAMVEMGTAMVTGNSLFAPASVRTAFAQAVAQGGFQQAPLPEFGGYAWSPGSRLSGTAVFVTLYESPQEAATTVKILTDTWARLGASKFSGAVTEQRGVAVVTTLADVRTDEFIVRGGQLSDYPGFISRN